MARLIDKIRGGAPSTVTGALDYDTQLERAGLVSLYQSWQGSRPTESLPDDFLSYVKDGYRANSIIFALILVRGLLFSDIEFKYQRRSDKTLFGGPALGVLEEPWPNGTTGEMLFRMEQDVSLAGNAYVYEAEPGRLQRLRPDWVQIMTDGRSVLGYLYTPGIAMHGVGGSVGGDGSQQGIFLGVDEVAHWSPIPDPEANYRGMSWITPVVREVLSDKGMTRHKQKFFEQAATPNLLIKIQNELGDESRQKLKEQLDARYHGVENAYRTMVLDGGADATVIGANLGQMSFDVVQAAGENRIAAAAGVPGIVAGFKEGLQAATYSNYEQALRRWVDISVRPQWRSVCVSLAKFADVPGGSRLWYDTSQTAALRQADADRADILLKKAQAVEMLARSGYSQKDAARVVEAMGDGFDTMGVSTAPLFTAGQPSPPAPDETTPVDPIDVLDGTISKPEPPKPAPAIMPPPGTEPPAVPAPEPAAPPATKGK